MTPYPCSAVRRCVAFGAMNRGGLVDRLPVDGADVLSPRLTATLCVLVDVHRRHGRATVRAVAEARGMSTMAVHAQLQALRDRGFVAWEPRRGGTLRPLVEVVA